MLSVESSELPENALLQRYRESGDYTDCYFVDIERAVSQAEYIQAFYTTLPFKTERLILRWAVAKPSSDEDASLLAAGKVDRFAAWLVEARQEDQILLSDFRGRTRSWLMTKVSGHSTRLYFGSAVVKEQDPEAQEERLAKSFGLLLGFHRLYSRVLLSSAKRRLLRLARTA